MIAALAYSVVPPVILGRMKQPVARRIQDKVVHTDALMQKADWMTGVAAIVGILGVGFGLWWADSAAALVIAVDIVRDGFRAARAAAAELADGLAARTGRRQAGGGRDHAARPSQVPLSRKRCAVARNGSLHVAELHGVDTAPQDADPRDYWPGERNRAWRLAHISFSP